MFLDTNPKSEPLWHPKLCKRLTKRAKTRAMATDKGLTGLLCVIKLSPLGQVWNPC